MSRGKHGTSKWKRFAAMLLLLAVTGCAHQSTTSRIDADALLNAISIDDVGYVRHLVAAGQLAVDERVPAAAYPDGAPLITLAARDAALATLRYLISAGADINARTPVGETALMLSAYFPSDDRDAPQQERYEQAVRLLLDAGAEVESGPYDYTALSYAAYHDRRRIVGYLLGRGAKVDGDAAGGVAYVNTPLMMAAIQGHYETALSLLRAGADPRIRSYQGLTAAELAAKHRHPHLAQLLRCAQAQPFKVASASQCR